MMILRQIVLMLMISMVLIPTQAGKKQDPFLEDPEAAVNAVNEGVLTFLLKPPVKAVHHHHNTLTISPQSIRTGWVKLSQCHKNLDKFPRAEIVYNKHRVRKIKLTMHKNIEKAWVEGGRIQLENVGANAIVCMQAESKALRLQPDGSFIIQNGPFMRKFLDGYYPMRVSMDILLPKGLSYSSVTPVEQKGFSIQQNGRNIHFDAWFEGRLVTRIKLKNIKVDK